MRVLELLRQQRNEILKLASQHGARNVRVFGSAARGEAGTDSDIDFLVELEPDRTLFDLGALVMDLQDLLDRKIINYPQFKPNRIIAHILSVAGSNLLICWKLNVYISI